MENVKVPVKCAYTSAQWGHKLYSGSVRKNVVITSIQIKVKLKYNELGLKEIGVNVKCPYSLGCFEKMLK